jgi:pyruvate/2-oxoglutarate/acetoin dehydrogenase E1 component
VELIDLRSLWPLDPEIIRRSLRKTGRLVVAHHSVGFLGPGAEVAAWAADQCFELLKGPIRRVAPPRSPVPFAPALERDYFPTPERILGACLEALQKAHA